MVCPVWSGSIYAKRDETISRPLYSDAKATQVGDILTIVIVEQSKIDNEVERDLKKETNHELGFNGDDFTIEHLVPSLPDLGVKASSKKSTKGQSDYKDERTFEDSMTVVVEDVLPNGNLLVMGTRERDVAGDKQTIQLSGIVRPRDITFNNTVSSSQVANFKLVNLTEGVTEDYNNPGWLASIFDTLWPF
jgi:flagellar L-ring protein precursor FlgH